MSKIKSIVQNLAKTVKTSLKSQPRRCKRVLVQGCPTEYSILMLSKNENISIFESQLGYKVRGKKVDLKV